MQTEWTDDADDKFAPVIVIDVGAFRQHFEDDPDPARRALAKAPAGLIAVALDHGFSGDFWWAAFDECYSQAASFVETNGHTALTMEEG